MKTFRCDHCHQLVFFENTHCVSCGNRLAYLPDLAVIGSLDEAEPGRWTSPLPRAAGKSWRLCENYATHDTCNWAVPTDDPNPDPLCASCRVTTVIPDISKPALKTKWYKLEVAKRRLLFTLAALKLPVVPKDDDPDAGLAFEFKADPDDPKAPRVLTGHADGVITINVAEADDPEREKRRQLLREPYRTLLGHVRHEVGHYYWDRLIRDDETLLSAYRERFGDERADYGEALKKNYTDGPVADWSSRHVTSYASVHPWEDWAETWAHYLHIVDTLETAAACGVTLRPHRRGDPKLTAIPDPVDACADSFDEIIDSWYPLTYMMNSLNRGMGVPDAYPFVLSPPAVEKLRFVHETVATAGRLVKQARTGVDSGSVILRAIRWLTDGFPSSSTATAVERQP
ncbi:MAG: zinc-binding metallopeptidase family protein [Fimbriiglobus sp.]